MYVYVYVYEDGVWSCDSPLQGDRGQGQDATDHAHVLGVVHKLAQAFSEPPSEGEESCRLKGQSRATLIISIERP